MPLSYNKRNPISCKIDEEDGRSAESQTDLKAWNMMMKLAHPTLLLAKMAKHLSVIQRKKGLIERKGNHLLQAKDVFDIPG